MAKGGFSESEKRLICCLCCSASGDTCGPIHGECQQGQKWGGGLCGAWFGVALLHSSYLVLGQLVRAPAAAISNGAGLGAQLPGQVGRALAGVLPDDVYLLSGQADTFPLVVFLASAG